ncbi:MAG: DUF402 domain-containing protein [Actinobacteria bacterium]|nr:DUF402 domain-containing protein [Actinomycetota bacterium]
MERALIRKIKRPGPISTWAGHVVSDDEFGLWVFSPNGTMVHTDNDGVATIKLFGNGHGPGVLCLLPSDEWWLGCWWTREPGEPRLAIDACTPPVLIDGIWTWIDLELDVFRDSDGVAVIEDEDEFDDAVAAGHIPPDEQREALAITAAMERQLRERVPPFDETGWRRHDEAAALGLPPLAAD